MITPGWAAVSHGVLLTYRWLDVFNWVGSIDSHHFMLNIFIRHQFSPVCVVWLPQLANPPCQPVYIEDVKCSMVFIASSSSAAPLSPSLIPFHRHLPPPCLLHLLFFHIRSLHFLLLGLLLNPFSSYFSTSSPCAAALHQPITESAVRRIKAGIHYFADVRWNADVHCMHPSAPPLPFTTYWSVSELCLGGRRLTYCFSLSQTSGIDYLLPLPLDSRSLQASGCTLSHCNNTPFQHSSYHLGVEVRGRVGVGRKGVHRGLGAGEEHSVPEKRSTGSLLLSTNSVPNGWWDHTVWSLWLASVFSEEAGWKVI